MEITNVIAFTTFEPLPLNFPPLELRADAPELVHISLGLL